MTDTYRLSRYAVTLSTGRMVHLWAYDPTDAMARADGWARREYGHRTVIHATDARPEPVK